MVLPPTNLSFFGILSSGKFMASKYCLDLATLSLAILFAITFAFATRLQSAEKESFLVEIKIHSKAVAFITSFYYNPKNKYQRHPPRHYRKTFSYLCGNFSTADADFFYTPTRKASNLLNPFHPRLKLI